MDVAIRLVGRVSLQAENNLFSECKISVAEFIDYPDAGKNVWTNNLFDRCTALFLPGAAGDVTHGLFAQTPFRPGYGNINASPAAAAGMGLFGSEIGPGGERLLLAGAPVSPTPRQNEAFPIWGPGLSHYRY